MANNKLVELQNQFQEAGISIYSEETIVGEAIIYDLVEMTQKGGKDFLEYMNKVEEIDDKKEAQIEALARVTPLRNFFARIRKLFKPKQQPEIVPYTEEEQEEINACLSKYIDTTNQVMGYNLSDNLVATIVRKVLREKYKVSDISALLQEDIIPDLQKLGLSNKIAEFKEELIKEYEKDISTPVIQPEVNKTKTQEHKIEDEGR